MIAQLIAMALITKTYGGTMSVVQNLSEHDCAEARSVALYGESVEDKELYEKRLADAQAQAQKAWETAHPKQAAQCRAASPNGSSGGISPGAGWYFGPGCGPRYFGSVGEVIDSSHIETAQCVK